MFAVFLNIINAFNILPWDKIAGVLDYYQLPSISAMSLQITCETGVETCYGIERKEMFCGNWFYVMR